jgi:hypothetical protein
VITSIPDDFLLLNWVVESEGVDVTEGPHAPLLGSWSRQLIIAVLQVGLLLPYIGESLLVGLTDRSEDGHRLIWLDVEVCAPIHSFSVCIGLQPGPPTNFCRRVHLTLDCRVSRSLELSHRHSTQGLDTKEACSQTVVYGDQLHSRCGKFLFLLALIEERMT